MSVVRERRCVFACRPRSRHVCVAVRASKPAGWIRIRLVLWFAAAGASGCAGLPGSWETDAADAARLSIVGATNGGEMFGGFDSIDGRHLKTVPHTLSVKPGRRTIGYLCELILDGPPAATIEMDFLPGKAYEFRCAADGKATVVEK